MRTSLSSISSESPHCPSEHSAKYTSHNCEDPNYQVSSRVGGQVSREGRCKDSKNVSKAEKVDLMDVIG